MKIQLSIILSLLTTALIAQAPFITTWITNNPGASNDKSITIPTTGTGYRYDVDWESDGVYDDIAVTGNITHEYDKAGTYTVSIRGAFPRIHFSSGADDNKIVSIDQWGDIIWLSMENAFRGASNLQITATDSPNLQFATSLSGMFRECTMLNSSIDHWEVSSIIDMSGMFFEATSFNQSLNGWDVSSVTSMVSMFKEASNFNGNISDWDVREVEAMSSMFQDASSFNRDIGGWNTMSLTHVSAMFNNASSFNQDISTWNTSLIESMGSMFWQASSFNQSLGNWNIENVSSMINMFFNTGLNQINYDSTLIKWSAQNVQSGVHLGANNQVYCLAAEARDYLTGPKDWDILGDSQDCYFKTTWKTDNPGRTNSSSILISTISNETYDYDVDWDNDGIFDEIGITGDVTHDFLIPGIYSISIRGTFPTINLNRLGANDKDPEKIISIDAWGDIEWTTLDNSFSGCSQLIYNATDQPNLSNVNDLSGIFFNASLINFNAGAWDIRKITDMELAFSNTNMSIENYDSTLFGWAAQNYEPNVNVGANNLEYCLSNFARNKLASAGWTFDGDSENCTNISRPFVIRVKTDNPGESIDRSFTIPKAPFLSYDFDIDWENDGVYEDVNNNNSSTHTYYSAGTYTIAIKGEFPQIYFNNEDDVLKIIEIVQWGDQAWESMEKSFYGASNLQITASDAPDLSQVESMTDMFRQARQMNADISNWDVSNVTFMERMFSSADAFNQDISNWDVSNVRSMVGMFSSANSFDQNLGSWVITSVLNMASIFSSSGMSIGNYDNTLIGWADQEVNSNVPLSAIRVQYCNGEDARNTLINTYNWNITSDSKACNNFITVWKTDNPGTSNSSSITIQKTPIFNHNYDVDWENDGIFDDIGVQGEITHDYGTPGIYTVAIRGDFPGMFFDEDGDPQKLIRLDQWGNIIWRTFASAFKGASNMVYNAIDTPNISLVSRMNNAFDGATLFNGDLSGWDMSRVLSTSSMFKDAESFNSDINSWDVSMVTSMEGMFWGASSFNQDLDQWDVSEVFTMRRMFEDATSFNGNISTWDLDKVNSLASMFKNAISFNQDLDQWDVEFVTLMASMFSGAVSFNGDISNWKVNNVTFIQDMFRGASSFNGDIRNWIVNSAISFGSMFRDASSFDQDLGEWDVSNVTNMLFMFDNSGLSTSNYDNTLNGWLNNGVMPGTDLGANSLKYCNSEIARNTLITTYDWDISGDAKDCSPPCGETVNTWTGPATGMWDSSSNWSEGEIPNECHQVVIPAAKTITIPASYQAICYNIEIANGGSLSTGDNAQLECSGN